MASSGGQLGDADGGAGPDVELGGSGSEEGHGQLKEHGRWKIGIRGDGGA